MLSKDLLNRALHTFWQAFIVVFLAGVTNVFGAFQHNLGSGKSALLALALSAIAAGLSALKGTYLNSR